MSLNQMMNEFNTAYGVGIIPLNKINATKAYKITNEEMKEVAEEVNAPEFSPEAFVKEMLDNIYADAQQLISMGVDVDLGMKCLHQSNMSKLVTKEQLAYEVANARHRYPNVEAIQVGEDLYALRDMDSLKVVKPTTYTKADVTPALRNCNAKENDSL